MHSRRVDKRDSYVLICTDKYHGKICEILRDATEFVQIKKNPMEDIKRKLNGIQERVNAVHGSECLPMVTGDHDLECIHRTVKAHKHCNPLRSITFQIPSPTYAVVKEALN